MTFEPVIQDETKATSQHQITIPKKIWSKLRLKTGTRFQIVLTRDNFIVVSPKPSDLELSQQEWNELRHLARSKSNVTRSFTKTKDAIRYLKDL